MLLLCVSRVQKSVAIHALRDGYRILPLDVGAGLASTSGADRACFRGASSRVDLLTAFGLFAVTAMVVCYAFEDRSHWYVPGFAAACALGSIYGFLQGAWPFGIVEAIWAGVALRRCEWPRHRFIALR